jgi:hypothetical protein
MVKKLRGNSLELKLFKANIPALTVEQKEILIGLALGDMNIRKRKSYKHAQIRFEYGGKNIEYGYYVYSLFKDYFLNEPVIYERINVNGNLVKTIRFESVTHPAFDFLVELFLDSDGKKRVPSGIIEDYLTPRGLAFWFMDDGGKLDYSKNQGKGVVFNTQGFSQQEVMDLCEGLKRKFNLDCWIGSNKSKHVIKVSGKNFKNILDLIGPFIIPSMTHKLPSPRKPT